MKDATLKEVIWNIEKQSGFVFAYNANDLARVGKVSVNIKEKTVLEALNICLKGTGLSYVVQENIIVIKQKETKASKIEKVTVRGKVVDKDGAPLPGVTILIKGTTVGVSTNGDGQYAISVAKQDSLVFVFSFIGLKTKEVKWNGQEALNVVLEEDSQVMDEVVVSTGYNTVNRRDMVGSYTSVKAADIMMPAYNSIDQMLQGQIAGMVVMNTSSRVGTTPKIKLRGTTTIFGNQSPLWVVDGIVQEDPLELETADIMTQDLKDIVGSQISWLNPMDIETITVLKDASATAVYGSKASNGVIVITTKKGKVGRLTVNYTGNMTINTRPNYGMFNYMNSKERVQFSQDVYNAGVYYMEEPISQPYTYEGAMKMYLAGDLSYDEFMKRKTFLSTVNTDWFDLLTRSAVSHSHNVSLAGGTEAVTYNVSLGYNNTLGQEIGNSNERMTGRVAVNVRLHEKVRLNASLNATSSTTKAFGEEVNPMSYATTTSRSIPAYDEEGNPVYYQKRKSYLYNRNVQSLSYNFINERNNSGSTNKNLHVSAALNFKWDILDWLSYEFTGGYTASNTNGETYNTERTFRVAWRYRGYDYGAAEPNSTLFKAALLPFGGVMFTTDASQRAYNIQNKILISKSFNDEHRLNAMLAMELRSSAVANNANKVWGYMPDRGETLVRPTPPDELQPISNAVSGWGILDEIYGTGWKRTKNTDNYLSFFATVAYSLKNRYVFNFSMRNDESNRFGQDVNNRFDPTYSFGLSWKMMDEPWLEGMKKWLNAFNVRATYGIQGNAMTKLGPDLTLRQYGILSVYNQHYSKISSLPNPNLSWEKTKSWDWGVDMTLFNIFDVVVDYYRRNSNVIVTQDLPSEYGISTMNMNGGKITNEGVEFTVSFTPVKTKDWALSISLNSSKNWNETGKEEYEATRNELLAGNSEKILKKGYPVGGFWSYSFAGLSSEDGRPLFNYFDVPEADRNSSVDPTTYLVYSGTKEPNFTGGLNFSLRWKTLTLSSGFSLLLGCKKRLPSPYANIPNGAKIPDPDVNLSKDLTKRWKKPGDENYTKIPGLVTTSSSNITLPNGSEEQWMRVWEQSDALVADASFLRCRQLSLSWRIGEDWCKRMGLKTLSLNATVSNLFVIASKRFNGFDPELGDSVHPKNYSVGINIGF
ncbi:MULTISPECIES: SusC/RagA family TonB-linked outer membrane protein [Butyricimonas]|uniref:SusC/RagA family TonB-linked outer membrane protein n=1 Tax=Butyricimonas TaxID=574697 RepID=UPI0009F6B2A9|nr:MULTISPECIES: SusC/RagA family TonB-linked outer membrane protein [Butyricimonas]